MEQLCGAAVGLEPQAGGPQRTGSFRLLLGSLKEPP